MRVGIAQHTENSGHSPERCAHWSYGGRVTMCVVRAEGSGPSADFAAQAALGYVAAHLTDAPLEIVVGCHQSLKSTAGASIGLAIVDRATSALSYAGIGGVRAVVKGQQTMHLVSTSGLLGVGYRRLSPKIVTLAPGDLVLLLSAGLPPGVDPSAYSAQQDSSPHELAKRVLDDWRLPNMDASVVVGIVD